MSVDLPGEVTKVFKIARYRIEIRVETAGMRTRNASHYAAVFDVRFLSHPLHKTNR
jgi:hypothetical protein